MKLKDGMKITNAYQLQKKKAAKKDILVLLLLIIKCIFLLAKNPKVWVWLFCVSFIILAFLTLFLRLIGYYFNFIKTIA